MFSVDFIKKITVCISFCHVTAVFFSSRGLDKCDFHLTIFEFKLLHHSVLGVNFLCICSRRKEPNLGTAIHGDSHQLETRDYTHSGKGHIK